MAEAAEWCGESPERASMDEILVIHEQGPRKKRKPRKLNCRKNGRPSEYANTCSSPWPSKSRTRQEYKQTRGMRSKSPGDDNASKLVMQEDSESAAR